MDFFHTTSLVDGGIRQLVEKPDKLTTFGRTKLTTSKLLFF
jgi:hypothetical protein